MQTGRSNTMATGRVTKKVLEDIEILKDEARDMHYKNGSYSQ